MEDQSQSIADDMIATAAQLSGLSFTPTERELMPDGLAKYQRHYTAIRSLDIPNHVAPALRFDPRTAQPIDAAARQPTVLPDGSASTPPPDVTNLAFAPITALARLIKTRQITSVQLTELYLERLKRYDPSLRCVVTLTEELAWEQASRADAELAAGNYRGPLHGIPWGAKDLLATHGIRTTWGAAPYRDQVIDEDAAVVQRLAAAGAVLVAKLSVGELAWGDIWFDGETKSPWNIANGSSGSSAGPGSATAAGLVGFSIGTETWGSIVSPSSRCGITGLRPTFGRVSRHGAMALSWSMDKIGPMCRSVVDCGLVFEAIYGPDGRDLTVIDQPFTWRPGAGLTGLRIGYLADAFAAERSGTQGVKQNDEATLDTLRSLGAELVPIRLPDYPVEALSLILNVEAAAAFDELTRSGRDELLVRQVRDAWPNVFRQARLVPAVEYIQANRIRSLVMQAMAELMTTIDVYVAPSFVGDNLLLTNLTGHPAVVVPNGFSATGEPTSITFTGQLFGEAGVLAVAEAYQDATSFHLQHPPMNF